jgi:hypothetical protein
LFPVLRYLAVIVTPLRGLPASSVTVPERAAVAIWAQAKPGAHNTKIRPLINIFSPAIAIIYPPKDGTVEGHLN